jgi:ApbE superfamily uncharacterized protein (UPF0280 family)
VNTKLTLRLDDELISTAKRYSAKSGKSLSQLVADYFTLLAASTAESDAAPTPRVRALIGVLANATVDEADYRRHLEDKHR